MRLILAFLVTILLCFPAVGFGVNQPVKDELADMVEQVVVSTGLSINISQQSRTSVNINKVNGLDVCSNEASNDVLTLQQAFDQHPNIYKNIGPRLVSIASEDGKKTIGSLDALKAQGAVDGCPNIYISVHGSEERDKLKAKTRSAFDTISKFGQLAEKGEIDIPKAQQLSIESISGLAPNNEDGFNYFFIIDSSLRMVHHLNPVLIGKDMSEFKDPRGSLVFVDMKTSAVNGDCFSRHYWPKPGTKDYAEKLSCSMYYEPWGWIVSTSSYVDQ